MENKRRSSASRAGQRVACAFCVASSRRCRGCRNLQGDWQAVPVSAWPVRSAWPSKSLPRGLCRSSASRAVRSVRRLCGQRGFQGDWQAVAGQRVAVEVAATVRFASPSKSLPRGLRRSSASRAVRSVRRLCALRGFQGDWQAVAGQRVAVEVAATFKATGKPCRSARGLCGQRVAVEVSAARSV